MSKPALVMDIDKTTLRGNLTELLHEQLVHLGLLKEEEWEHLRVLRERHERHQVEWHEYDEVLINAFEERCCLRGLAVNDVRRAAEDAIERHGDHLYRFSRALMNAAREHGYPLVFISGSPLVIVEPFAKRHGSDIYYGTVFVEEHGIYTGSSLDWAQPKDQILDRFAQEHNIDLMGSVSVGDALRDVAMFQKTGYQILFNPNPELYEENIGRPQKWHVVMEEQMVFGLTFRGAERYQRQKLVEMLPENIAESVHRQLKDQKRLA